MNDADITKLAAKLTVSLATKADIKRLEEKIDTVLKYAEAVDETTDNHEKRLKTIERIPIIAHELKSPRF